ncbi:MAG: serine/threonine protein kinase [Planctomycetes bacterium]|nr:serine/threonine protein kinase [Planctomycetota bacterium]
MAPQRWKQVNDLFNRAAELPADKREAFLEQACGSDMELRDEVRSLLAYDNNASGFLSCPTTPHGSPHTRDAIPDNAGRRIGAYRLIRQIAVGGMGSVWLADRADDQFKKQVAIKLIKRGMDTDDVLRRFHAERQVLARLEHPNIARLHDGGATDDGLPFLVMEHIDGTPLTDFCNQRSLTIRQRLRLFQDVCAAVQYAHRNLVVHRDLKPANILITADGAVKLLDFGIAKVLEDDAGGRTVSMTRFDQRPMTPEYASPEQIRGEPVTTSSDVYSLGVVLYELLTGMRPHRFNSHSLTEYERVICNVQSLPPSQAVPAAETPPCGLSHRQLQRALAGDIDTIVLKALRKEPHRRYATVDNLADDIRRHLNGQTVTARPDTRAYRLAKFVRRNTVTVAFTALVFLLVAGFAVVAAIQSTRIADERDRAKAEAKKAQDINHFLNNMLASINPSTGIYRTRDLPTLRAMLDDASGKLQRDLTHQPDVEASLRDTLGRVYLALGLYDAAEPHLQKALTLRTRLFGVNHLDTAASIAGLGALRMKQTRYAEALPLMTQALGIRRNLLGDDHELIVTTEISLAESLHSTGHYLEAEQTAQRAIERGRRIFKGDHAEIARGLHALGFARWGRGDFQNVEACYKESLAMRRRLYGNEHASVAMSLNNLAALIEGPGRLVEAESMYREALAITENVLGDEHPQAMLLLNNLANVKRNQKDWDAAGSFAQRALALARQHLDPDHYIIALSLGNLAKIAADQEDYQTAEPLFRESLAVASKAYPESHPQVGVRASNLGECLAKLGRFTEAEALLLRGHSTLEAKLGSANSRTQELIPPIIACYEAWHAAQPNDGYHDKAQAWRTKLTATVAQSTP